MLINMYADDDRLPTSRACTSTGAASSAPATTSGAARRKHGIWPMEHSMFPGATQIIEVKNIYDGGK